MTETQVEVEAPTYPPELMNKPFAVGDELIVVQCDTRKEWAGQRGLVIGGMGVSGTEGNAPYIDIDGNRAYVQKWIHPHLVDPVVTLSTEAEVGSTVRMLTCLCCPSLSGSEAVVVGTLPAGILVEVTSESGATVRHLASSTTGNVTPGSNPLAGVECNPDVNVGDRVYIMRNESSHTYNFQVGSVTRVPQVYATEYRNYITATVGGRDVWVSHWLREADIPATMPPIPATASTLVVLDVFGSTPDTRIGQVGHVYDRLMKGPRLTMPDGNFARTSQWAVIADAENATEGEDHRHPVPKGTRVRILATKSETNKKLVGEIGVMTADVNIKRDSALVAVEGERLLVTEWVPVDHRGVATRVRYLALMSDKDVEKLIEELFITADKLADKQDWCSEYDGVMHEVIGRPKDSIRLTQCWRVEVAIGDPKANTSLLPGDEGKVVKAREVYYLVAWGNKSVPNDSSVKAALKKGKVKFKGRDFYINNYWRI